jgi:hypothetical protein
MVNENRNGASYEVEKSLGSSVWHMTSSLGKVTITLSKRPDAEHHLDGLHFKSCRSLFFRELDALNELNSGLPRTTVVGSEDPTSHRLQARSWSTRANGTTSFRSKAFT